MKDWAEFCAWEDSSRDTIDVKRCYVDLVGDLIAGILLSQIIYWFLPSNEGTKLRIEREGEFWLAKSRTDWWNECRISPKQFDRAIHILKDKGLVKIACFRFKGSPTIHIQLIRSAILQGVNSILTKGENPNSPKGKNQVDERVKTLTETTPETTTEITTEDSNSSSNLESGKVFEMYESNIGQLTPVVSEELKSALQDFPAEWVIDALKIAAKANKRNWRYIEGILRSWANEGRDVDISELTPEQQALIPKQPVNRHYICNALYRRLCREEGEQFGLFDKVKQQVDGWVGQGLSEAEMIRRAVGENGIKAGETV